MVAKVRLVVTNNSLPEFWPRKITVSDLAKLGSNLIAIGAYGKVTQSHWKAMSVEAFPGAFNSTCRPTALR